MNKETLRQILLSERTKLFCVLDGAQFEDLPVRLYEMNPPNYCLFTGDLEPDMLYVAPFVVNLLPNHAFTDWVFEQGVGKNQGIFAHSLHSIKEMRKHFRALVDVYDEQGEPLIFRFYDPRVLRRFLPTCRPDELKTFFGKIQQFFAEDEEKNLVSFALENDSLKESKFDLA